jgi:hypothetical protein
MPPATQETSQLSDIDTEKLVKDVIFHIISQEAKRPLFKKPDILKAIGLSGRDSEVKDPIFQQAIRDLKDVFGYELKELDTKDKGKKGCYILVNTIEESSIEGQRHMKLSEKEEAQLGLLTVILSVIYMNNNLMKEDALFSFLESLDLCEKDATRRDGSTNDHKDFGNIKTLIDKEWCQKHHYIHMEKDENSDPDQPHFIYSWGDRALVEVKKSEILKFVAEIYEKEPSEFTEQYENIRNIEGEDVFADE